MLKAIKPFIPLLIFLSVFVAAVVTIDIYINLNIKDIIDKTLTTGDMNEYYRHAKNIFILLLAFFPALLLNYFFRSLFFRRVLTSMKKKYMKRVFKKNINEFRNDNNSMYVSSLTNDYDQIENNYIEPLVDLISSLINFAGGIILFTIVSPWILLIAFGLMVVNLIISAVASKPLNKHNKHRSELFGDYTSYIKEVLSAFHIIKTNDLEDKVRNDFYNKSEKVQQKGYVIDKISSYVFAIQNANFNITFIGLFLIVGWMCLTGYITFGAVVLIINSVDRLVWPVSSMSEALPKMFSVKSIFSRINKTLKNQQEYHETLDFDGFKESINIENVNFGYEDNDVLNNINIKFEKGRKYLIIGPSGGGKSTVLKLLRKYFLPNEGEIYIDGIPLRDIKKEQYFNHIANIEQNVFMFEDTIRNNLTLYKTYTDEEVYDAINRAGLSDFINGLPDGLNTMIYDNGKNISGGERSRLAIARGLLNKADIIFLDEAFASLDVEKAKAIEQSILDLKDVTVINVSHVVFKEHQDSYDNVYIVKDKNVLCKE